MKTAACFLLLLVLPGCYYIALVTEANKPLVVVAAHDIAYQTLIQASDIEVPDKRWYTPRSKWQPKVQSVVGHITVRNIRKGEPVENPGDVLPFAGHPKN